MKAAEGALDFVDLLLRARDLLRDDAEVRRTFRERLSHLFVDEFQDTDPLQAEIVVLLAGAPDADRVSPVDWRDVQPRPGSLFIVGDPKQSIYRFRRADIGTYRVVCDWLRQRNAKQATLTTSFRATPAIQRFVNAAFAPLMTDDAVTQQPPYVRLTPLATITPASQRWWRCRCPAPTAHETSRRARSRSRFPMPSGRF